MPINVQCDKCERRVRVNDNLAGKKIKCPQCQNILTVGPASPDGSAEIDVAPPKAAEKAPASKASAKNEIPIIITTETKKSSAAKSSSPAKAPTPPPPPPPPPPPAPKKASAPSKPAAAAPKESPPAPKKKAVEAYFVKTEDEEYYGPVPKAELDEWVAEGRLGEECQLLLDGTDQWLWASDIYPDLATEGSASEVEQPPEEEEEEADEEAATFAVKVPEVKAKKSRFMEEEPAEEEPPAEEPEFSPPVVTKKSNTKSTGKKKQVSRSSDEDEDEEVSDRSQMVALLLAIFLGFGGTHRYYLGYVPQAVIQQFTCGGALVWQIIDIVQILRDQLPDVHGRPLKK